MPQPALTPRVLPRLRLATGLRAAGGLVVDDLSLPADATITRRDDGSRTFEATWAATDPWAARLRRPHVVQVVRGPADTDVEEFAIRTETATRTGDGGSVRVLAERPTEVLEQGALRRLAWRIEQRTAQQILAETILPGLPAWVLAGTVDGLAATLPLSLGVAADATRVQLLAQVVEALRDADPSADVRWDWRPVGAIAWAIDIGPRPPAAATPELVVGLHLDTLETVQDGREQLTVGEIRGADGATLAEARWRVQAVDLGAGTCTLVDPDGGAGPVQVSGQLTDSATPGATAPVAALLTHAGTLLPIAATVAASPAASVLTITPAAAAGLSALAVGDLVPIRAADGRAWQQLTHPAGLAASGAIWGIVSRPDVDGIANLLPNAVFAAWSAGPLAPPDAWVNPRVYDASSNPSGTSVTRIGAAGELTGWAGVAAPRYGDALVKCVVRGSSNGTPPWEILRARSGWLDVTPADDRVTVTAAVLVDANPADYYAGDATDFGLGWALFLRAVDATGMPIAALDAGNGLTLTTLTTPRSTTVAQWVTYVFDNIRVTQPCRLEVAPLALSGGVVTSGSFFGRPWPSAGTPVYLDALQLERGAAGHPIRAHSTGTRLWQALQRELGERRQGLVGTSVTLRDLAAVDPDAWGHVAVPLGARARCRTPQGHPLPIDLTARVTGRTERLAAPDATTLALATRAAPLAELLRRL